MAFDFISNGAVHRGRGLRAGQAAHRGPGSSRSRTTGDPRPGIEARVHDPLWLIGRQWQLGEFEGEDAGTPLTVRVVTRTVAVDRWAAGDGRDAAQPLGRERQTCSSRGSSASRSAGAAPGLRAARRGGARRCWPRSTTPAWARHRAAFAANCPLDLDPPTIPTARTPSSTRPGSGWSACSAAAGWPTPSWSPRRSRPPRRTCPPGWSPPTTPSATRCTRVVDPWLRLVPRRGLARRPAATTRGSATGSSTTSAIGAGEHGPATRPRTAAATSTGTRFDAADRAARRPARADRGRRAAEVHALLASPLRYPGMPADRLWEMEDAQVNLGVVEAEPWDLARLLVAEFALTYGNDWLVVPVDVPFGSLTTVESVIVHDHVRRALRRAPDREVSPDGRWRMFTVTDAGGAAVDGLLVPPGAVAVQDGPAVEEVLFLRDEMANLAWAVERSVQGPSGFARDRARERDDPAPAANRARCRGPQLDYLLQTGVPGALDPLPAASRPATAPSISYRAGCPTPTAIAVAPLGPLLNDAASGSSQGRRDPARGRARAPPALDDPPRRRQLPALDDPPRRRRPRRRREPPRVRLGHPAQTTTGRLSLCA